MHAVGLPYKAGVISCLLFFGKKAFSIPLTRQDKILKQVAQWGFPPEYWAQKVKMIESLFLGGGCFCSTLRQTRSRNEETKGLVKMCSSFGTLRSYFGTLGRVWQVQENWTPMLCKTGCFSLCTFFCLHPLPDPLLYIYVGISNLHPPH